MYAFEGINFVSTGNWTRWFCWGSRRHDQLVKQVPTINPLSPTKCWEDCSPRQLRLGRVTLATAAGLGYFPNSSSFAAPACLIIVPLTCANRLQLAAVWRKTIVCGTHVNSAAEEVYMINALSMQSKKSFLAEDSPCNVFPSLTPLEKRIKHGFRL